MNTHDPLFKMIIDSAQQAFQLMLNVLNILHLGEFGYVFVVKTSEKRNYLLSFVEKDPPVWGKVKFRHVIVGYKGLDSRNYFSWSSFSSGSSGRLGWNIKGLFSHLRQFWSTQIVVQK